MKENELTRRSSIRATAVYGLAVAFYFYELMILVSPSVMMDDLALAFQTTAEQLGMVAAFYYYAYALMQIPVGLLMDRFGPRILLTIAAALCALGCVIFGSATVLWAAKLGRFVMGMGGAFAVVGCLKLASLWFAVNRFAFLTGIMVAVGMMGCGFGQAPIAKVLSIIGWRETVFLCAITGAILSVVIWFVVANEPVKRAAIQTRSVISFWSGLKQNLGMLTEIMRSPQAWIVALYAGLMFVPTTAFGQLWGVPYFVERYQIDKIAAGAMVSMIFLGWAVGGPLYGWISDKMNRRKWPMGVAALSTVLVMGAILYLPVSPLAMKGLMFLLGAFSSGFILAFSIVREINIPLLTGTAIGFINTLNNASGALAQPVVGMLLDKQLALEPVTEGAAVYTLAMYNSALLFLPICVLGALLLLPFIRETYCRPVPQPAAPLPQAAANDG